MSRHPVFLYPLLLTSAKLCTQLIIIAIVYMYVYIKLITEVWTTELRLVYLLHS